jgi:hypothetical protein
MGKRFGSAEGKAASRRHLVYKVKKEKEEAVYMTNDIAMYLNRIALFGFKQRKMETSPNMNGLHISYHTSRSYTA